MPTVFISHSSADKPFAYKLAFELLAEGIPVWLDKWELGPGDPLISSLDNGLASSARVLVVVSKHAAATQWVQHEVTQTLKAEKRLQKRLLLPVRIDPSGELPDLADRVHIDIDEENFVEGLHTLIDHLRTSGLQPDASDRVVLPLLFHRGTELDKSLLERIYLRWINAGHDCSSIAAESVHLVKSEDYNALQRGLQKRISTLMSRPEAAAEDLHDLRAIDADVVRRERDLRERTALVLREFGFGFGLGNGHVIDVLRWYTRIAMHYMQLTLAATRSPQVTSTAAFVKALEALPGFAPDPSNPAWWNIVDPTTLPIRHRDRAGKHHTTTSVLIPRGGVRASDEELETYPGASFRGAFDFDTKVHFVLPQMLQNATLGADWSPAAWNEDNFVVYRKRA